MLVERFSYYEHSRIIDITYLYTTHYVWLTYGHCSLSYTNELLYYHFCVKAASVVQICVRKARQSCVAPSLVCSNVEAVSVQVYLLSRWDGFMYGGS